MNKKPDLDWTIHEMRKLFRKKIRKKRKKNSRMCQVNVKTPHVNKKPLARKRIFVETSFSYSTLKLEKIPTARALAFSLHLLFWRDQNHELKNHENV